MTSTSTFRTGDLERAPGSSTVPSASAVLRSFVWVVLVASMAGNTVASLVGAATPVNLGLGLLTLACAITLATGFLRRRR